MTKYFLHNDKLNPLVFDLSIAISQAAKTIEPDLLRNARTLYIRAKYRPRLRPRYRVELATAPDQLDHAILLTNDPQKIRSLASGNYSVIPNLVRPLLKKQKIPGFDL